MIAGPVEDKDGIGAGNDLSADLGQMDTSKTSLLEAFRGVVARVVSEVLRCAVSRGSSTSMSA